MTRWVIVLGCLVACRGGDGAPALQAKDFASGVVPPLGLAKLRIGMSIDEAKQALPGLAGGDQGRWTVAADRRGVRLAVHTEEGAVRQLGLETADGFDLAAMLDEAWGEPDRPYRSDDTYVGVHDRLWRNPDGGWKARLDCETRCTLSFRALHPLTASYLGKAPQPPAAYATLRRGMPEREMKALVDASSSPEGCYAKVMGGDPIGFSLLAITVPASSLPLFEQAWGGGSVDSSTGDVVWIDRRTGWKVTWGGVEKDDGSYEPTATASFTPLWTAADIVGAGPADLALFARAGLGATVADMVAAYAAKGLDGDTLTFDFGWEGPSAFAYFDSSDKIRGLRATLWSEDDPELPQAIEDALEVRFGKPRRDGDGAVFQGAAGPVALHSRLSKLDILYGDTE